LKLSRVRFEIVLAQSAPRLLWRRPAMCEIWPGQDRSSGRESGMTEVEHVESLEGVFGPMAAMEGADIVPMAAPHTAYLTAAEASRLALSLATAFDTNYFKDIH
jgi:hypothetical protein